jgi:N5-(cytidine 5'-diphosphoramidyl)-L-glutamine hydrolase
LKLIAVSQRIDFLRDRGETRDSIDQNLSELILLSGNLPVPVPNGLATSKDVSNLVDWLKRTAPQGVILSGGNDLGEYPIRDATEACLIHYAQEKLIPVLGICRGMQMLAHSFGASMRKVEGHVCTKHNLVGEVPWTVNSFHNFSISKCPDSFKVIACSEDGEIEGIKHTNLPWEGWMWHPERENPIREMEVNRVRELLSQ